MNREEKNEYIAKLLDKKYKNVFFTDKKKIREALDKAWEIRNFEIKLYWKRALYFWGFIALTFYAPFAVLNLKQDFIENQFFNKFFFITIICIIGCVLSFAWYLANRSSKFYQENWERWINLLEEFKYGNIYKTLIEESGNKTVFNIFGAEKYSLSRLNIWISLFITIVWASSAVFCAFFICDEHSICLSVITLLLIILINGCLLVNTKS